MLLGQADHEAAGVGPSDAAAHEEKRPLGLSQQARRLGDGVGMRRQGVSDPIACGRQLRPRERLIVQDVPRNLHEDGAAAPRHGRAQGGAEQLGNASRRGHLDGELGHGPEHAHEVVVLERVLAVVLQVDPAHEDHDGGMGDMGGGHPREQVGRARTARDEADPGNVRHPGEAVGHEGGRLLVTDVDVFHAAIVVEGVQDVQEGRADDPEDVPHLLGLQQLDDGAPRAALAHRSSQTSCMRP